MRLIGERVRKERKADEKKLIDFFKKICYA